MPGYAWRHRISNILEAIGKEINTVFARQFHGMYLKLKLKCLDNDPSLLNSILAIDKDFKQDDDILFIMLPACPCKLPTIFPA